MSLPQQGEQYQAQDSSGVFVLPLNALHRDMLALVGGKAANLGELTNAKLPVPPGFCVTTNAYALVAADAGLQRVLETYAARENGDAKRLEDLAQAARDCLLAATIPTAIADAITGAYGALGAVVPLPVAVRSSATAEDLPFASFAGQQDTYLNVVGVEAVVDAVRHCFASLWTNRAVSYRESLGLDQRSVKLAVVVQRMVEAEVAGVLFTANPVTGKRRQAVIDANPGLGEAVVSGATNPDHFVVNTATGELPGSLSSAGSGRSVSSSGEPPEEARSAVTKAPAGTKPASPMSTSAPWLSLERASRRIMASRRISSGPSIPKARSGSPSRGRSPRSTRCRPAHRRARRSCASMCPPTWCRASIVPSLRPGSRRFD